MLDAKMKEVCRICARELCGNQRRWIFHPASKLNLQVLLSHALGWELTRDGRGEFACSKCAFMLDRMYRFDTVIARVEVLSLERLHKLLLEKDKLRQCIGGLYRKNNSEDQPAPGSGLTAGGSEGGLSQDSPMVDLSVLQEAQYSDLVQDDLAYSVYESWADQEDPALGPYHHHQPPRHHPQCSAAEAYPGQRTRRCRGCAALRVADSDYEAVCKVPRRAGRRSTSCGPSTRYSGSIMGGEDASTVGSETTPVPSESLSSGLESERTLCEHTSPSPASSVESLDTAVDVARPCTAHIRRGDDDGERGAGEKESGDAPPRRDLHWEDDPREGSLSRLELTLSLVRAWEYRPVKTQQGSRLPVLVKAKLDPGLSLPLPLPLRSPCGGATDGELYNHSTVLTTPSTQQELALDLAEMEELWMDDYVKCGPFRFQQKLVDEQQGQLTQYESAAGQCVGELQKAQLQVRSLQAKIRESETRNQKLRVRLSEMEMELRSAREEAQRQERNILNLSDTVSTREAEAVELYRVIEEQGTMLCSFKELANRNQLQQLQMSGAEGVRGQGEVLSLQASLFQAQLELQAGQRAQQQATRREEDLGRALERLEQDLQGALQHRRETERHNQDLQLALEKARSALQERGEQMREQEGERKGEVEDREKTIRELRSLLQTKQQVLQEYSELLEQQQDPGEKRDAMLQKLRERIKERDRALERAVDEKFCCVEEKEGETRRLQLLVREKERDLERQRCVLSNNEETITSLETLLRGKGLELEQVCEAWRAAQCQHQGAEERQGRSLTERDALISQLQAALHTCTKEVQELRNSLLAQRPPGPSDLLEELRGRLQLKERLFQEVLSDRAHQAQEHQAQVQDLLHTITARDQYIQDSSGRLGEVMSEQTSRLQELRRQLTSTPQSPGHLSQALDPGPGSASSLAHQTLQEELHLAMKREREAQEESYSQAGRLEALARTILVNEGIIKDYQKQLAEPSALPLVERLTRELQELRESLVPQDPARGHAMARDRPANRQAENGGGHQRSMGCYLSDEGEDDDDGDANSEYADSIEEEEDCKLTAQSLATTKVPQLRGELPKGALYQDVTVESLVEVKQLVEQKRVVERELGELKAQLEKAGFSSLSQMRKAMFSLRSENDDLKSQLIGEEHGDDESDNRLVRGEEDSEEEDLDVTIEEDEDEVVDQWDEAWDELCSAQGKSSFPTVQLRDGQGKNRCPRPISLELGALLGHSSQEDDLENEIAAGRQQSAVATVMVEKAVRLQQESKDLQERLMVSEATVQAQAEQLKDYRVLLTETSVQQDSKLIQVDLQDLGYETCGRSENEAEREDTSSPEFDDLEMCTSLEGGSQWWPTAKNHAKPAGSSCGDQDAASLQRLVQELRSQLSHSQGVIRGLQSRLRSLSTSSDCTPSTPRKVNWSFQAEASQSGPEEDEGWQSSSDGGPGPSPRHPCRGKEDLQELVSRVGALEDQLKKGGKGHQVPSGKDDKAATWPGKFDTLIQAQARELSHLRQRMREGRGVCHILTQHLGDTTKGFEELLRANDIDYYMGQSFRDQLAQSTALAQRVSTKISGRDHPEVPDDKTGHELLAIRLSKELQQKDKVIESLRAKLNQHQPHHQRSDSPCSTQALSEATDQSDRVSFVSEQGSTNEDLEMCSEMDAASEYGQEETRASIQTSTDSRHPPSDTMPRHPSLPPFSITSHHGPRSSASCPSMHFSPPQPKDPACHTAPGLYSGPMPSFLSAPYLTSTPYQPNLSALGAPLAIDPHAATLRPRYHGRQSGGFSLAEVHQELQMLQRQLGDSERFSMPQSRPLPGYPMAAHSQAEPTSYPHPLSYHGFHPSPLAGTHADLSARPAMKGGPSLLEGSSMCGMAYGPRPAGADLSSGSSGYQSGPSHTGRELMKEHLREIRSLRQRLEDSIQTNERLRQQLEERLANSHRDKGAPTNIYIQGLDSLGQLSSEIRALKEDNVSLQSRITLASRDGSQEAEQLREAALLGRARLKEAELEVEHWAEQSKKLHTQAQVQTQEITQLKQDRQRNQETINRLQHEMTVLQQQLGESCGLVHSLQCELQVYQQVCGVPNNTFPGGQGGKGSLPEQGSILFDPKELHVQLEQSLIGGPGQVGPHPSHARRKLFGDNVPSPPVRDTGLFGPAGPLSPTPEAAEPTFQAPALQGHAPDGSFANRQGCHVVGHVDDFKALHQQILEANSLISKMESALHASTSHSLLEFSLVQPLEPGCVRNLLTGSKTLRQILEEASSLLRMFWRAALPSTESHTHSTKKEQSLEKEIRTLRFRISEQEEALRDAMGKLKSSNSTKDSMEHFIVSQLSRTRDVLKTARTNLQENELKLASLRHPNLSPSSSLRPLAGKGTAPGVVCLIE
ncbi:myomegalin [Aplochiton taeniatus]